MLRTLTLLMTALLTLSAGSSLGVSFAPKEFDQLVAESEQIFVGTVTGAASRKLPAGGIVTDVTFTIAQVLKGSAAGTEVALMVLGGTVDGETLAISGIPRFQIGIRYVVFVQGNGTTIFPVVGGDQGMFQVKLNADTGENFVFNSRGMPVASPSVRQAMAALSSSLQGTLQPAPPIPLDVFLQAVRDRLEPR